MNPLAARWADTPGAARFAFGQTNRALRDRGAMATADALLAAAGLPGHPDRRKNWDTYLALFHAVTSVGPDEAVLDAGAERYSAFLPSLRAAGYTRLEGVNLTFGAPEAAGAITYRHGDVTATGFGDASFAFIACLSVIEHGVDPPAFLAEASRLLVPGGTLFISVDYWQDPVPTAGRFAYGVPVRLFTRDDLDAMIAAAAAVGLRPEQDHDFTCGERVIEWTAQDLRYTFANMLLRRAR